MTIHDKNFVNLAYRMLRFDESDRQFPYDDLTGKTVELPSRGKITIGIGRNLTSKGLSAAERLYLFENDLKEAVVDARHMFPEFDSYSMFRQLAIVNLIFNMGARGFSSFKNTIQFIKKQDWESAARNLEKSKWFAQVKTRGPRVVKLLEKEVFDY